MRIVMVMRLHLETISQLSVLQLNSKERSLWNYHFKCFEKHNPSIYASGLPGQSRHKLCSGPAILGEIHIEEHHLKIENARLRGEYNRICAVANKFLGRPLETFHAPAPKAAGMANSALELAVGRNDFGAMNSVDTALPMGLNFGNGISISPRPSPNMASVDVSCDKNMLIELAFASMTQLIKLAACYH